MLIALCIQTGFVLSRRLRRLATKNNKNIILEKLENRREAEKVFAVIDTIENVYKKITQI